jgi:uncharacterized membrane protein/thiol-disulfide isomerase/thioredoxin
MDAPKGSLGRTAALLAPVLAGLVASAALAVDYVRPTPVFCEASGCAAVKQTVFASFLGVPTPVFGLLGFLLVGTLALTQGKTARNVQLAVAAIAALVGLGLLGVQALLGVWCKLCLVADTSASLAFGMSLWRRLGAWDPPEARLSRGALASAIAAALAVPIALGVLKKPVVPDVIAREIAQTPEGEVTLVDFADYECPFCRMTHAILAPLLAEHHDHVRVVRKNVPLTRLHPHALDAARAACCGEQMGKGDAMSDALFSAPTPLGKTGPSVFPIGLGCMGMSGIYGPSTTPRASPRSASPSSAASRSSTPATSTAWATTSCSSGAAIEGLRDKVQLSVKFGAMRGPDGSWLGVDTRPAAVKTFAAYSLKRLGVEVIDVYRPARLDRTCPSRRPSAPSPIW